MADKARQTEWTIQNCNPNQLEGEIRGIPGFPRVGLSVYTTEWPAGLVIIAGEISPEFLQAVDGVIARHIPDFTERNEEIERSRLIDDIRVADSRWDELPEEAKTAAVRNLVRLTVLATKHE